MKKTALILSLLLLAVPALAQPGGGQGPGICDGEGPHFAAGAPRGDGMGPRHGGQERMGGILMHAEAIGLTDDQKSRLETMRTEFQLHMVDLRAEVRRAQIKLQSLKRDDDAPEVDVMTAIDQVTARRAAIMKAQYRHHEQVKSLLTQEQIDKLKELRQERFEERGGPEMRGQGKRMPGRRSGN